MIKIDLTAEQGGPRNITLTQDQLNSIRMQQSRATGTGSTTPSDGGAKSYQLSALTDADVQWLRFGDGEYKQALRLVKGAHQLPADMLTNPAGKTVWDLGGPQGAGSALQLQINQLIKDYSAGGRLYDPKQTGKEYTGPLRQVMSNLIASKQQTP